MTDIFETLDQAEVWVTGDGQELRLEDMAPSHRANVLRWLRRNARSLQAQEGMSLYGSGMPPVGSVAMDMVMGGLIADMGTTPEEWLQEQPLVERLTELVMADQERVSL